MDPMESMSGAPVPADFNAQDAVNMEEMEMQFAVKAVEHMQTYWSLLQSIRGSSLRLTKLDDDIATHLSTAFPEFDATQRIDEDALKSPQGKARWREFMMAYEKKIDDYNFGTLVRNSASVEYAEDTTIFVPRIQFYAIEIARNRQGANDWIYEQAERDKEKKKKEIPTK